VYGGYLSLWSYQRKLIAADEVTNDNFGTSLTIMSNYVLFIGVRYDDDKASNGGMLKEMRWEKR
jgi:hypothetical protein